MKRARPVTLADDAAHGALFTSEGVSEVLGTLAMAPSLNLYRLWVYGHNKVHHGFTSLTSLVRGRLGPEGWRLRRDGPRFQFISLAADIVIVTDDSAPMRALMSL